MVPQSRAFAVLITRPQPQAGRFAAALRDRYGDRATVVISPLLSASLLAPELPTGPFGALILTSETGARAAAAYPAGLPRRAYCVGERTAEVAASLGFDTVSADGDAEALLDLLCRNPAAAPFLHLRGAEARGNLAERLRAHGLPAEERVVYDQRPQPLTPEATHLLAQPDVIVPLFSPRSASLFFRAWQALPQAPLPQIAALSPAVAAACGALPPDRLQVAAAPNQAELFRAMDRFIITG